MICGTQTVGCEKKKKDYMNFLLKAARLEQIHGTRTLTWNSIANLVTYWTTIVIFAK